MYSISDLFDMRSVVGAKLEAVLSERSMTKAKLCNVSGISRPTMDKLLSGNLTSKTNYEKHIEKVLMSLEMTPDMIMGSTKRNYNRFRSLRNTLNINEAELSEFAGVSLTRLKEIEGGADATIAEIRDIAYVFYTSVRSTLGTNYFWPQLSMPEDILNAYHKQAKEERIYGFWGHLGIRPALSSEFLWLPITGNTRDMIYDAIGNDRMVVPCMNNKLLLINMRNIDKIVLLDDACDEPSGSNWDHAVSCGEVPLVLYEALEDYAYYKNSHEEFPEDVISPSLCQCLDYYIASLDTDIDEIAASLNHVVIRYSNGKKEIADMDFSFSEDIVDEISSIYEFGDFPSTGRYLSFQNYNGENIFLNFEHVAFIELPLLKVEDAICNGQDEMISEQDDD